VSPRGMKLLSNATSVCPAASVRADCERLCAAWAWRGAAVVMMLYLAVVVLEEKDRGVLAAGVSAVLEAY
jgi:hypothetical protein